MIRHTTGPEFDASGFQAVLRGRAARHPDRRVFSFVVEGAEGALRLSYGELDRKARALAAQLQGLGLAGERALLLYPPGLEFIAAFLGCLYAGVVAVPATLPRLNRPMGRLRAIASDSAPRAILTTSALLPDSDRWAEQVPEMAGPVRLATDTVPSDEARAASWRDPGLSPDSLAFLQYTSGSTAAAKGVMVSHGNLVENSALIARGFGSEEGFQGVSWLPLYHDMGLIGSVLQTIYRGGTCAMLSPVAFLQRPIRWLQAISDAGASISGGPNFAYDLCVRKIAPEQKAGLDLSSWTVAFNGAEPVRAETLDRFAEAFAPCGFRREAFLPCYGLAEATLMVAGGPPLMARRIVSVSGAGIERNEVRPAAPDEANARALTECGPVGDGQTVVIADPETRLRCAAARIGEIWVAGPTVAQGYWNRPEATEETFRARLADSGVGPFLRTGDLGFLQEGRLYVTGRLKDLIIIRGRNVYPQDIEWTTHQAHPALRTEGGAAFAVEIAGEERLVIVQEAERVRGEEAEVVARAIRQAISEQHELDVYAVCLIKPLSLPKTSSGKVQRHACRDGYLAGTLETIAAFTRSDEEKPILAPPAADAEEHERDAGAIADWLAERIARSMRVEPSRIDARAPFASFGLGSLQAIGLAGALQDWLGRDLSPTLIYDYPTIEGLARHLSGGPDRAPAPVWNGPEVSTSDAIAIIGIGCRFPGADGPEAFWDLLRNGVDAIGTVPPARWENGAAGPAGTRWGGFLARVDEFDAPFFGIAPREAVGMDPQQRLLLEVAWEALEDAGQVPERLAGTTTGVFLGISTNDYGRLAWDRSEPGTDYLLTGNAASIAANRLSYLFDFRGPSLAIDTACSSSLVAVHLACQSLRRGEATLALAAGANLILSPEISANFAKAGFLAPDGRCKSFDARANGYVRGEGVGVVVLKPLALALADGDPIHAVIRGSAVNQDGRSNGLTAPNRQAQEDVLRAAYRAAGVAPGSVQYVEAHGTGTFLGDPIEAGALGTVLAAGRAPGNTCLLGSVKTNIGHLEAAAGVAGLIKVALALTHREVPPSLHFQEPNPHVPFDALALRVATEPTPWPLAQGQGPALAGVSAFGFGGTNAHVVVQAAPERVAPIPGNTDGPRLLPLSARTPEALRVLALAYHASLADPRETASLEDIAYTASVRRGHHAHRLTVLACSRDEARVHLDAFLQGETRPGLSVGRKPEGRPPALTFVFSGQGGHDPGMGRSLLEREPVFRAAMETCDRSLRMLAGWSLLDALQAGGTAGGLDRTDVLQPVHFAIQVALAALWKSWGVVPDAVVGHSLGEAAAAHLSGALELSEALAIVVERSRLMRGVEGLGKAAAIGLTLEAAEVFLAEHPGRLFLAAVNGPSMLTLSGDPEVVDEVVSTLRNQGTFARTLPIGCAVHSPRMDPLRRELERNLAGLNPKPATIPFYSTVTGQRTEGEDLGAAYWGRNLRETVRFASVIERLADAGPSVFLEIGPHSSLVPALTRALRTRRDSAAVSSLRRAADARETLLDAAGTLHTLGLPLDWGRLAPAGRIVRLPAYPWQRERYWLAPRNTEAEPRPVVAASNSNGTNGHAHHNGNGHENGHRAESARNARHAPHRNGDHGAAVADGNGNGNGFGQTSRIAALPAKVEDDLADCLYELRWRPVSGRGRSLAVENGGAGRWLIVADQGGNAGRLVAALEARGASCLVYEPETNACHPLPESWARPDSGPLRGIVHLRSLDTPSGLALTLADLDAATSRGAADALRLVQALAASSHAPGPRLWLVTRSAQATGAEPATWAPAVGQSPLWGIGRSIALEQPDLWGGLIDLDPEAPVHEADALALELLDPDGEDQLAFRNGQRLAARLARREGAAEPARGLIVRPEGTYLVTGGLGELGLRAARWLTERGARRIVLLGRRGLPPRETWEHLPENDPLRHRVEAVQDLERLGATVAIAPVDVADAAGMSALFEQLRKTLPPVRGILHVAGLVTPHALRDLDLETFQAVLRPKVAGTLVLHELSRSLPLDFFVAFSSVASVLGAKEAHYAAANQFLDTFAQARRALGLPALSVNWGPWAGGGMATAPDRARAFRLLGLSPLPPELAFEALERLARLDARQAMVARVDWFTLKLLHGQEGRRRLLEELEIEDGRGPGEPARNGTWAGLNGAPEERLARLVAELRGRVAEVLRLEADRINSDRPLNQLGLDSLMAIELKSGVESDLGLIVPISLLMQGPTLNHLAAELLKAPARPSAPFASSHTVLSPAASGPLAVSPLSVGQEALWSLSQLNPESAAYNIAGAATVRAEIDADALRRSFQRLVDRHGSLRTTFPSVDGRPVHRVRDRAAVSFHVEDASGWSEPECRRRLVEEANRPFDLERGPLFRAFLFTRSAGEHDLLLSVHHIVSDFWSIAILMDELAMIYPAERAGRTPSLPPLEREYTDYVRRQAEMLSGPEGERLWEYWREQLAGPLPVLELPADRPRPPVLSHRGASRTLPLGAVVSERLSRLGASRGASLYVTLLAAFQVWLGRCAGQEDVIVGSPVAGRNGPNLTPVVGYFVNPLPFRARLAGNPTFLDVLGATRKTVLDGLEHQALPFASMVDRLSLERDPSRTPVFQVMFVYQKAQRLGTEGLASFALRGTGPRMNLGEFPLESLALEQHSAQFDLTLMAAEGESGLNASLEYNIDLFDAATIDRLLASFETLLEGIVARPEGPIDALPLLAEAERRLALIEWNETRAEPAAAPVLEQIELQADRTPDALALSFEGTALTYRDLDRRANQLAHHLLALGVGPEVRVGLRVQRPVEMIVAILGVLKAGGAYVPLDPDYPADRLAFMLADARVGALLTEGPPPGDLPDLNVPVVRLDLDAEIIARESAARPAAKAPEDALAYVIYTSGSTGQPKGVMVSRRNLAHSTHARALYYREPVRGFLLVSSFAFDSSVAGLFWTLSQGGTIVLPSREERDDPVALGRLIQGRQVSHVLSVPSFHGLLLAEAPPALLAGLRAAIVAGESCSRELVESHRATLPNAALFNEYGPTEASVWSTVSRCEPLGPSGPVPIGRPIANTRIYLLDGRMRPVPIGAAGALYLGGDGVTRGYLGRPALTAERFVPDPFAETPGARLYKTGDLARWRPDGALEFLGRLDRQVKIRGYRIELGEIEDALARHPAVREVVVVAREETPGDPRLAAYLVPAETPVPEAAALRSWVKRTLPAYMVPSAFVVLDALPLSPNGKVDHKALPAPGADRAPSDRARVAPGNRVEAVLARITAGVLGLETVSVAENFFDLGIDSILSIQIVSRARREGVRLSPGQLFQHPTIAELALVADTSAPVAEEEEVVAGPVPLTPIQRWFLDQDQPHPEHFNQAVLLEIEPAPETGHLAEAVRAVIDHHDALRLRFTRDESGWRQVQARATSDEEGDPVFASIDLSALGAAEQTAALAAEAARAHASLNLELGPLARFVLFRLGPDRPARLLIVIHHLAVDGVSWRILLEDLAGAYQALRRGEAPALPPKTTSFRRWAETLARFAESGALDADRDYWLGAGLSTVPRLPVDLGVGGDPGTVADAATVSIALDAEATGALLREVPRASNSMINDALLSGLARSLAPWIGGRTILVDIEGHGRDELDDGLDLSRTVGWFTTVFPVQLSVDPDASPAETLRSVKEQLGNVPRNGIGHGLLSVAGADREIAERLRDRQRAEIRFNYLGQLDQTLPATSGFTLARESAGPLHSPLTRRSHLLEIDGRVVEGELRLDWTFNAGVHRRETIAGMAERFLEALRDLVADCRSTGGAGYTPADFPLARLDQAAIDRAVSGEHDIEDIYPLSPMQEGMLFHTTLAPESGVYIQQFTCRLRGALDVPAFASAWQSVLDRHPALRTAFRWIDLDRPMQVVSRNVTLPIDEHDWRGLSEAEQGAALETYLAADRARGFVPSWAPLLRVVLFRLARDIYQLVWSYHHLVMDGWCLPIVLEEVLAFHEAKRRGRSLSLPPTAPFRDYIAWLRDQDSGRSEAFWRHALGGFTAPTPLGVDRPETGRDERSGPGPGPFAERRGELSDESTAELRALGRSHHLTLNTLVQGAWALILSRYSGQEDVVFGTTVAGRPPALADVERMVGLFINTLPVRVKVPESARLLSWLKRLQDQQVELREHEHSPLVQVHGWSGVPRGALLFESILVFENYPLDATLGERAGGLGVDSVRALEQTNYPLTLMAIPGDRLKFRVGYDTSRFDGETIDRMLGHLGTVLETFANGPGLRLSEIALMSRSEQDQLLRGWNSGGPEVSTAGGEDIEAEIDRLSPSELDALLDRFLNTEEASHE